MDVLTQDNHQFEIAAKRMIAEQIIARGISDERVIAAMARVPRHLFVDEALKSQAYIDAPLNIGDGQTISQPYIVALMTQSLNLTGKEKILELGTGCGYQTTILSLLAGQVYTIERVKTLAMKARQRCRQLGVRNVVLRVGDGSGGWPDSAPFNGIIVTCAAPALLAGLKSQLAEGGRLVIPVSAGHGGQDLLRVTRRGNEFSTENLGACRFVKLIGKYGYA